jgi:hypothetical protein
LPYVVRTLQSPDVTDTVKPDSLWLVVAVPSAVRLLNLMLTGPGIGGGVAEDGGVGVLPAHAVQIATHMLRRRNVSK